MTVLDQLLKQYGQLLTRYQAAGGEAFDRGNADNALINYSYHSNAIEGNTFTYEQTFDFLKTGQVVPGKSYQEHAEHRDLVGASKLARQFASDQVPLSEGLILAIHRQVLNASNPEHAGRYRDVSVLVGNDSTPYPAKARAMMKEMVAAFPKAELEQHPLVAGAMLHLDTVLIHPFRDGNGRTARLLLDYVLLKHNHPSVLLRVEDKPAYFQAIREAKAQKDHRPFANFVIQQANRSLTEKIALLEKPSVKETKQHRKEVGEAFSPEDAPSAQVQKKKAPGFDVWQWEVEKTDF